MANNENNTSKIIRSKKSGWSELPKELYPQILSATTLKTIKKFKAVCPSWSTAADEIIQSPTFACLPETTWLVLPGDNKGEAIDGSSRFYGLNGSFYNSNINMPEETREAICFGTSHGWLVLLNNQLEFMLSTPFLHGIQLPLPPLNIFPDVLAITCQKDTTCPSNIFDYFSLVCDTYDEYRKPPEEICTVNFTSVKDLASKLRAKAVLSSRPTCSNKDRIGVLVMYMFGDNMIRYTNLAFCTTSDHKWTKLEEPGQYLDIMGYDNEFYVLMDDYTVDIWDFSTSSIPMKKMEIKPVPNAVVAGLWRRCHKVYMIKTAGTGLLLIVADSEFPASERHRFHVYKMEGTTPVWKEVKSIGRNAIVLGSNNSAVLSRHDSLRCHGDSIYYVKKSESESYNLHVFSLKNKSKKEVCELPVNFEPLAFSGS